MPSVKQRVRSAWEWPPITLGSAEGRYCVSQRDGLAHNWQIQKLVSCIDSDLWLYKLTINGEDELVLALAIQNHFSQTGQQFFFSLNWSQNDDGYSCDVCEETTKDSCSVSIFNCYVTTLMKVKVASDVIVHVGFPWKLFWLIGVISWANRWSLEAP